MIRFNNDYNHGAHPLILKALEETNSNSYGGYGMDEICAAAREEIKKYLDCPQAAVHFLVGGTQANYTVIAAALRPYQAVISADTGHINAHETGAVENTGHKIHALKNTDGKISAEQIEAEALLYAESGIKEHITQPKMVYISHPSEFGTLYTKKELEDIRRVCDEYGMYLFVDGARLAYALGAEGSDVDLKTLASLCDVFYCGGTKCGALFGEAVVICNPALNVDFRSYIKQNGGMLAKGWLLGLQFYTLFKDGLYLEIGKEADRQAMRIKRAFAAKGIEAYIDSCTNQQFVVVDEPQYKALAENYVFEDEGRTPEGKYIIRFCTSWSSTAEEVEALCNDIEKL